MQGRNSVQCFLNSVEIFSPFKSIVVTVQNLYISEVLPLSGGHSSIHSLLISILVCNRVTLVSHMDLLLLFACTNKGSWSVLCSASHSSQL